MFDVFNDWASFPNLTQTLSPVLTHESILKMPKRQNIGERPSDVAEFTLNPETAARRRLIVAQRMRVSCFMYQGHYPLLAPSVLGPQMA